MMDYRLLQKQIDSFIGDYGSETLIHYLQDFKKNNPEKDYEFCNILLSAVLEMYKVSKSHILDMNNLKPPVVDARRQLVYFITNQKGLPNAFITNWFGCKIRTVYRYQKEVQERLIDKKIYKYFNIENEKIKNLIKDYV